MKAVWIAIFAAAVGLGAAAPSVAHAHGNEKTVSIDQIPPAAKASLQREANGAQIRRVEMETKNQTTVYEGVVLRGSDEVGIMVDAQGRVLGQHPEHGEQHHGDGD
jgi:hypothetical protein